LETGEPESCDVEAVFEGIMRILRGSKTALTNAPLFAKPLLLKINPTRLCLGSWKTAHKWAIMAHDDK
jgi:hypothetical protein